MCVLLRECVLHIRNKPRLSPVSIRSKQYCNYSREFASNHVAPCETLTRENKRLAAYHMKGEGGEYSSTVEDGEVGGGFLLRWMDGRKKVPPLSRSLLVYKEAAT